MSQSKNGNSSSNSSKFHKGLYGIYMISYSHLFKDTESLENKEDIYNTDIPIEHRISTLFKHLKAHKINQDIDIELLLGYHSINLTFLTSF